MTTIIETTTVETIEELMETVVKTCRQLDALEARWTEMRDSGMENTMEIGRVEAAISIVYQILDSYTAEAMERLEEDSDAYHDAWVAAAARLDAAK